MSLLDLFRRPRFCVTCGDPMRRVSYNDGFRQRDGTQIVRTWTCCPRNVETHPYWAAARGDCHGLPPYACAVMKTAYYDHKPPRCDHRLHDADGDDW